MKKWECRDLGSISEYLGMKIIRDRKNKILKIDQIDYAKKIVKYFGQENCHNVATPLPGGYKPHLNQGNPSTNQLPSVNNRILVIHNTWS